MSKTYRKRCPEYDKWWLLRGTKDLEEITSTKDFSRCFISREGYKYNKDTKTFEEYTEVEVYYTEKCKEGKKRLAKYHSDSIGYKYNRTGPGWWKTLTVQKPYRQRSRIELKKFLLDTEYEVVLESKPKKDWWD